MRSRRDTHGQSHLPATTAASRAGLPASFIQDAGLTFPSAAAVQLTGQAQFHVRKYLLKLVSLVRDAGGVVFADSRVDEITCPERYELHAAGGLFHTRRRRGYPLPDRWPGILRNTDLPTALVRRRSVTHGRRRPRRDVHHCGAARRDRSGRRLSKQGCGMAGTLSPAHARAREGLPTPVEQPLAMGPGVKGRGTGGIRKAPKGTLRGPVGSWRPRSSPLP